MSTKKLAWEEENSSKTVLHAVQKLKASREMNGHIDSNHADLYSVVRMAQEANRKIRNDVANVNESENRFEDFSSLSAIKKKFAEDVKEIEHALKECTERKSFMRRQISQSHELVLEQDNNTSYDHSSPYSKKSPALSKREKTQSMIHKRDRTKLFRRIKSAPKVLHSINMIMNEDNQTPPRISNPGERVKSKINFLTESQRNLLQNQHDNDTNDPKLKTKTKTFPSRKRRKGKKKTKALQGQDSLSNTVATNMKKREERRRKNKKKREQRAIGNKKRREDLEIKRINHIQENTCELRQSRYKKMALAQKHQSKLTLNLMLLVILGSRLNRIKRQIINRRNRIRRHSVCDLAAGLITRKLRYYCFKCYRKRVRGAIRILGAVFVLKIRIWRDRRRNRAADVLQDFLHGLKGTGAFLGILTRGKRWRSYKQKVIIVQRLWRTKLKMIDAQLMLIDLQWQKEQEKRLINEVDKIYNYDKENAMAENEIIDASNRGRKAMNIRLLPRKKISRKQSIIRGLLDENDFDILKVRCTTTHEIRSEMIRETLKYLKQLYMKEMDVYKRDMCQYTHDMKRRQRAGAFIDKASISKQKRTVESQQTVRSSINNKEATNRRLSFLYSKDPIRKKSICAPIRPIFRPVLGKKSLGLLIELADGFVERMRIAWNPYNLNTNLPEYCGVGKAVALKRYQEISEGATATPQKIDKALELI